jgi:glucokinase
VILAGDIGGTSTRIALVDTSGPVPRIVLEERHSSASFSSIGALARAFVARHHATVRASCFGVAGPVTSRRVSLTNVTWVVDADELQDATGAPASLLNDLVAHAYGLSALSAGELVTVNGGEATNGNRALIAAGTGLGEAGLFWDGDGYHPFPSEGGHADFAPHTDEARALLDYLATRGGPVSVEHVISGPGIVSIYEFLRDTGRCLETAQVRARLDAAADRSATISEMALRAEADICARTLALFLSCYGAEAGNFALKVLATGGVYIGGGIAPKIARLFAEATFMRAFVAKHRMEDLMTRIPVWLATSDRTALLGAARYAAGARSA